MCKFYYPFFTIHDFLPDALKRKFARILGIPDCFFYCFAPHLLGVDVSVPSLYISMQILYHLYINATGTSRQLSHAPRR